MSYPVMIPSAAPRAADQAGPAPARPADPERRPAAERAMTTVRVATHPYVGLWVTADGRVRHELLASGRYDEARDGRPSAYQGRYEVRGSHIDYWDDTGFTADGEFVGPDELHHGGMVLRREA